MKGLLTAGLSLHVRFGQEQTFAVQNVMSALPPKADSCSAQANVRFGPKADIPRALARALCVSSQLTTRRELGALLWSCALTINYSVTSDGTFSDVIQLNDG